MRRLALLASCTLLLSCGRDASTPDILLITLDTLRADRLGCYGHPDGLSPALDAFASSATRFERASAVSPWTLPSHASLFTGLYPFEHGAHSYRVDVKSFAESESDEKKPIDNVFPLADTATTLAETLAGAGYLTSGIAANTAYLDHSYGCTQGFADYLSVPETGDRIVNRALTWLDGRPDEEQPFLLFLNFMDTHSPYNVAPREGWEALGTPQESAKLLNQLNDVVLSGRPADPAALGLLRRQYDLSVANLDEQLGRLFAELKKRRLFDETLILVTSDHGEYLGEHQLIGHSKDVYEEAIAVPFLLKAPGQTAGRVEERRVSLVHAWGLLAEHCAPLAARPAPHAHARGPVLAENYYSRIKDLRRPWSARFQRARVAIYEDGYKFVHSTDQRHELYELLADPGEAHNLLSTQGERARRLNGEILEQLRPRFSSVEQVAEIDAMESLRELSPEERERLESLGYF